MNWNKIAQSGKLYGNGKPKRKKRRAAVFQEKTAQKVKQARAIRVTFYESREWKELRYQALKLNDGRCECCGRSKHSGVRLHVDHIKPRSRYPELQLDLANLQVLCSECNEGKSNKCTRDWRDQKPKPEDFETVGAPSSTQSQ